MADIDQVRAVKLSARAQLLARPGVHAVGIGTKRVGGQFTEDLAIVVMVVEKKPPSELGPGEMIPPEIDGVKTDVLARPMAVLRVADMSKERPLEGGIQIQPGDGGSGTLGCFTTIPGQPNRVFALTNFHVVGTPRGQATNMRLAAVEVAGGTTTVVSVSTTSGTTIEPEHSVAVVTLFVGAPDFVFYVHTVAGDTPATVAGKMAAEITAAGVSATVTGTSGIAITGADFVRANAYGRSLPNKDSSLRAVVSTPRITLSGKADGDFCGIFTAVSVSGLDQPTRGTFIAVPKNQPLSNIAAALAESLSQPGIGLTATSTGPTVTVAGADFITCIATNETRVGQSDAQFASECCDWCPDTIGRVVAARADLDAAVIELEPGLEYQADIKDIGHITGSRALTPADQAAHRRLRKRGRTTQETEGDLIMIDVDGFSPAPVDQDNPDLGRYAPFRFNDAFEVEALSLTADISLPGDSGSAILDGRTVVGLLFAGRDAVPASGSTPASPASIIAHHIVPLLATFGGSPTSPMQIITATDDDQTHEVPGASGARSMLGTGRNQLPSFGVARERIREVEKAIASTSAGRLKVEMVRRRAREAVALVNQNRRVGVAWQKHGGPLLLKALLRAPKHPESAFPTEIMGKPIDECLDGIARALRAHASPDFVHDLDQFAPSIAGLGGKTYSEMLAQLRGSPQHLDAPPAHLGPPAE